MKTEDYDDPRHIYRVRARRAIDQAEKDLMESLGLVPPRPKSPVRMMLDALEADRGDQS